MKINELAQINPKTKLTKNKFINYIDTSSVVDGTLLNVQYLDKNYPSRAQRVVSKFDILISSVRPMLKHNYFVKIDIDNLVASTGFIQIRCQTNDVIPRYLYYYLSSEKQVNQYIMIADSSQTTFPSFNKDVIENMEINLPRLEEQQHIVDTIGSVDDLIEKNEKIIFKLAEFSDLLIKKNTYKKRVKTCLLSNLAIVTSGKSTPKFKNGKFPIVGANGILGYTNNYNVKDDVIVTGRVGTIGTFSQYSDKIWCSDNTLIIKSQYSNYLYYYLKEHFNAKSYNRGSTQPLITQSDMLKFEINIPENIKELENTLKDNYQIIKNKTKENNLLKEQKNLLLKIYFE